MQANGQHKKLHGQLLSGAAASQTPTVHFLLYLGPRGVCVCVCAFACFHVALFCSHFCNAAFLFRVLGMLAKLAISELSTSVPKMQQCLN